MQWAKQSTAATLIVGPILDSTGAEYASAVIGDLSIAKHDASTLTALASAATLTYLANGQYALVLTTGNTDTLGRCRITCNKATYQMPPRELMILPATVYDALVTNATNVTGGLIAATAAVSAAAGYVGSSGAAVNGTNANTLSSHDPGATLGTSTLTQSQVTGGAYALNSASFAFASALDFTTTQKAATLARVTLVDTTTTNTDMRGTNSAALAATALSTAQWTNTLATNLGTLAGHDPGSTIMAASSYSAPPSAATISTQVASDLAAAHGAGSWATATGFSTLDAAGVRAAIGLATANLDTQVAAVKSDTAATLTYAGQIHTATIAVVTLTVAASPSPTASQFGSDSSAASDWWNDTRVTFTSGALSGQSRPVASFSNAQGLFTFDEAWTTAPTAGDTFMVVKDHIHPVSQIQSGLATATALASLVTTVGVAGAGLTAVDDATLAAIAALNNVSTANVTTSVTTALTTALTEGYRATNATGSVRDMLYELIAHMGEMAIVSTTKTLKKIDGSTTAKTYTLNDGTTPTAITEAT